MNFLHEHPDILTLLPSFARLSPAARELIYPLKLDSKDIWLILKMYACLKQSHLALDHPFALRFGRFIHKCDVAGALGHKNDLSSLVYT